MLTDENKEKLEKQHVLAKVLAASCIHPYKDLLEYPSETPAFPRNEDGEPEETAVMADMRKRPMALWAYDHWDTLMSIVTDAQDVLGRDFEEARLQVVLKVLLIQKALALFRGTIEKEIAKGESGRSMIPQKDVDELA